MIDARAPVELSILLVNWNTRDLTLRCLASVFEQTTRISFEVIVLDNGSCDGSAEVIAAAFPQVILLAEPVNHGFGRATNMQAKIARGEKLLLLNTDTLILDHAIDALTEFARANPRAGIWGGRTLFGDGTLNPTSCWGRMTPWSVIASSLGLAALAPDSPLFNPRAYPGWARDSERHVDIVTGCLLMIDTQFWKRLAGFDPRFFMYGEDVDLCLRAARLGARPMVTPRATIVHYGGGSTPDRADKAVRNLFAERTIMRTHFPFGGRGIAGAFHKAGVALRAAAYGIAGRIAPDRLGNRAGVWNNVWKRRREWAGQGVPQISGRRRLLAVSSSGGHWSQLMLLRGAFDGHDVTCACTIVEAGRAHGIADVALIPDCNRHRLRALPSLILSAFRLIRKVRPDVVVSTGALPGLACIVLGRLAGARTIWVESMANSETMSRSGVWASRIADECLVQWPQLERPGRTRYAGSVL